MFKKQNFLSRKTADIDQNRWISQSFVIDVRNVTLALVYITQSALGNSGLKSLGKIMGMSWVMCP